MYNTPDDLNVGDWFMVIDRAVTTAHPHEGTISTQFVSMPEYENSFQLHHMQLPLLFCVTSTKAPAVLDNRLIRFIKLRKEAASFMLDSARVHPGEDKENPEGPEDERREVDTPDEMTKASIVERLPHDFLDELYGAENARRIRAGRKEGRDD